MTGIGDIIAGPMLLAVPLAVLAGAVSFASPCVLPLVPGYLAYVGGAAGEQTGAGRPARFRLVTGVALFVLGFAVVFVVFGVAFGAAGFWLIQWRDLLTRLAGLVVIVMGLVFLGRLPAFQRTLRTSWRPGVGVAGAPLLGAVFAIGWTPCIGPTLAAILGLSLDGGSPWRGGALGLAYALGLGIPFLLVALGLGWASRSLRFLRRHIRAINVGGGALLVLMGVLMVTGLWSRWMLELGAVISGFVPVI